ncbi:hypothetical protein SAMN04488570_2689 [Nocardioides scoriae]|uniref:site-specific DNA-methyltransferase (adenine-specific) n=1 Tax=Nocardioides scoriae TaxID=642780 RepID=A0A1H1V1L7_9ACTN|nr:DNA methyltransferase [Nocardioides scoriae]SDS78431.1 hypothetical protein SAMN04488570_2689 [Nocardioides scoriae]
MPTSDALVVTGDWISEHFFTTDATRQSFQAKVLERRKAWDDEDGDVRTRFMGERADLIRRLVDLPDADDAELRTFADHVVDLLGYGAKGLVQQRSGPVIRVRSAGLATGGDLAVVVARASETVEDLIRKDVETLIEPHLMDDGTEIASVAALLSALFVGETPPAFALVVSGGRLLVAERERWLEGRHLTVDLLTVAERNDARRGGEVDRALACVCAGSLAPDAEGEIWWRQVLEESVKHTVGVSQDLREGVRLSVEIIANEVVRRRRDAGLDPLPADEAQPLAKQSLRFLYRILFLLYAEASPELGVLPTGTREYESGYSIDRLREMCLVELVSPRSRSGTHLYDSLATLFGLLHLGHDGLRDAAEGAVTEGLTFRNLRADLFEPAAVAHIEDVGLGNAALQEVLRHLLLSKEARGRDRGFISYAELGINQLGAVYEGLMSYTGFFAETDLYEVAKNGDPSKGSWVVPTDRADHLAAEHFVTAADPITGERRPVVHHQGGFVFRLAGRERQQSASYYTPEVLTKFVVSQALEELLDQDDQVTTAEEILRLSICEPALGSGAFAIEAVRQLADEYLTRRQKELGERIDPDVYPLELQRVKAHIALHNVHGVDLNATAVELAEISLWLDTMVAGLDAPWFGLHLRRGNSLIGARRAVYRRDQLNDKSWLTTAPTQLGLDTGGEMQRIDGRVPHFLLPAEGWGSAAEVGRDIRELAPDAVAALKSWRRVTRRKPDRKEVDTLVDLGRRVERLWEIAARRLEIAEQQIRRDLPLWGREVDARSDSRTITREKIEQSLADPDGAYQRLRAVMDAWCALWFWPLTEHELEPPTLEQWYDALRQILGMNQTSRRAGNEAALTQELDWDSLDDSEQLDRTYAGARRMVDVLGDHPWLAVCRRVSSQQGFFHWELEFPGVFARGGFDLQVGNPPWVRPDWDAASVLADHDVRFALDAKMPAEEFRSLSESVLDKSSALRSYLDLAGGQVALRESVSAPTMFPHLAGLRPDLYRCFMSVTWRRQSPRGITALLHPETHFTDERAGNLRSATYPRLRRHWQFINELGLFEIHNLVTYGVHVYGGNGDVIDFLMATSLYHPDTVERSLVHSGAGPEPGVKDEEGHWDTRPHRGRIQHVTKRTLHTWNETLGGGAGVGGTRMVFVVNQSTASVLDKVSSMSRMSSVQPLLSLGWDEGADFKRGMFEVAWGACGRWQDVILQGPQIHVANPMYKSPNQSMASNKDYSSIDLEQLHEYAIPTTKYQPNTGNPTAAARYAARYDHVGDERVAVTSLNRVAWRAMAANTGERTLIPALLPRDAAHVDGIHSLSVLPDDPSKVVSIAGFMSSLVSDFITRAAPKSTIRQSTIDRLPFVSAHPLQPALQLRVMRLNCVTAAHGDVWNDVSLDLALDDAWTGGIDYPGRPTIARVPQSWTREVPLRRASDRRQALIEIDALVALMLGLTADELCTIYRTQFPVLYGYDRTKYIYDANGREVPNSVLTVWRRRGDAITEEERTATHPAGTVYTYELPFVTLDREADMRRAYAHFEQVLKDRDG